MSVAVIPFRPVDPKTRLSNLLSRREREDFAGAMLADVTAAVRGAGLEPLILSTHPFEWPDTLVRVADGGLSNAINGLLPELEGPVVVIMADLPLVTPDTVRRLVGSVAECAIAPGRGGGTNALLIRDPAHFRVDYYQCSFQKHLSAAKASGLSVEVIDSFRLYLDLDEEEDLVDLLIHGEGRARDCLCGLGFSLAVTRGRVGIVRRRLPGARAAAQEPPAKLAERGE
ncbi:MAG: 2-phospho-L-lactate guanylyltransferase [Methanospirillum sp.]|nr:2-phospho-L-lactate guanylyltransferase [Methanospirillum sp.]